MALRRIGLLLPPLSGYALVAAQELPALEPRFEVASVRQNVSGQAGGSMQIPPAGQITFVNMPLRVLIREAYEVDPYMESETLISGPWARLIGSPSDGPQPDVPRWDVRAKPPDGTEPRERRAMMRALLEDRFKLRVHRETQERPLYALTRVREDRLGPSLAPSAFDCEAFLRQRRFGGAAAEPVDANGDSWCLYPIDLSRPGVTSVRRAGPVRLLVQRVSQSVDRPVIDATGLSGNVEWVLTFGSGPDAPAGAPDIFAALQDQLGLRLERREAPVEVLVIDHVELPTLD